MVSPRAAQPRNSAHARETASAPKGGTANFRPAAGGCDLWRAAGLAPTDAPHTRASACLPARHAPATYSERWQAPRSSDSASSAYALRTAALSRSHACRQSPSFHPAGGTGRRQRRSSIEHLLGISLDRCYEILSWPMTDLDPFRLSVWMQVWRVVFAIGIKAYLDGSLRRQPGRERSRGPPLTTAPCPLIRGQLHPCHCRPVSMITCFSLKQ
jgi:hypothetical protein